MKNAKKEVFDKKYFQQWFQLCTGNRQALNWLMKGHEIYALDTRDGTDFCIARRKGIITTNDDTFLFGIEKKVQPPTGYAKATFEYQRNQIKVMSTGGTTLSNRRATKEEWGLIFEYAKDGNTHQSYGLSPTKFPNGFVSWMETHHEIVNNMTPKLRADDPEKSNVAKTQNEGGRGAIYELAEQWTDEFETLNKDRQWDGEYYDELDEFFEKKDTEKQ